MTTRSYVDLARHYNVFVRARGCDHGPWVDWLIGASERFGITGRRVLSLGCGNCVAEKDLALRGYEVTGVDASADMLDQARRETKGSAKGLRLVHADIRDYRPKGRYDLIFSHYYTINYLTTLTALRGCFRNVYRSMEAASLFAFDIKYITRAIRSDPRANSAAICYEQDDLFTVLRRRRLKNNIVRNEYTNFFRTGKKGLYEMNREIHVQRFFRADEYRQALRMAGFKDDGISIFRYMTFSSSVGESDRAVFVCRKP